MTATLCTCPIESDVHHPGCVREGLLMNPSWDALGKDAVEHSQIINAARTAVRVAPRDAEKVPDAPEGRWGPLSAIQAKFGRPA